MYAAMRIPLVMRHQRGGWGGHGICDLRSGCFRRSLNVPEANHCVRSGSGHRAKVAARPVSTGTRGDGAVADD